MSSLISPERMERGEREERERREDTTLLSALVECSVDCAADAVLVVDLAELGSSV